MWLGFGPSHEESSQDLAMRPLAVASWPKGGCQRGFQEERPDPNYPI